MLSPTYPDVTIVMTSTRSSHHPTVTQRGKSLCPNNFPMKKEVKS